MRSSFQRLKSASQLMVVLFALGSIVVGLGQACSSSLPADTSTHAATTESSSVSSGSVSNLAITPSLQTIAYGANLTLVASGGTPPYQFFLSAGAGTLNGTTGVYTAPSSDANVSIGVSDATKAKVYAVLMVASPTSNITLAGTYSKVISTTFSNLVNYNGGCVASAPYSDGCNLAIHQFCQALHYGTGFGPNEYNGDTIFITCLLTSASTFKTVAYIGYSGILKGCNASAPLSDACLAAQSRYCKGLGKVSGFGPVTHDANNGTVECLNSAAADLVDVPLSSIQNQVGSCTDTNASSTSCLSGAFRYCRAQHYVSGFGLVEHGGGNAEIFCTK